MTTRHRRIKTLKQKILDRLWLKVGKPFIDRVGPKMAIALAMAVLLYLGTASSGVAPTPWRVGQNIFSMEPPTDRRIPGTLIPTPEPNTTAPYVVVPTPDGPYSATTYFEVRSDPDIRIIIDLYGINK